MANIPRVRDPGLWVPGSVVLQEEFEAIDEIRPWLINADAGSTHAPTTQIVLGGSGLRVSGASRLDSITFAELAAGGRFNVVNDSVLHVAGGAIGGSIALDTGGAVPARIDLASGTSVRAASGSFIDVRAGASADITGALVLKTGAPGGGMTAETGSVITLDAGSTANSSGDFYFSTSTWPKLSPARNWTRRSLLIATPTYNVGLGGPPTFPNSWKNAAAGLGDLIETRSTTAATDYTLVEFPYLPEAGTFSQVAITCIGASSGTGGMSFPQYQIVRWKGTTLDTMSALTADTHVLGNWNTLAITTAVAVNANATIDLSFHYGVMVYHAYYGGSPAGTAYFTDCVATGTAAEMRI